MVEQITLQGIAWMFNEAVSLLREARREYVPVASGLADEIDATLPDIQNALVALVNRKDS